VVHAKLWSEKAAPPATGELQYSRLTLLARIYETGLVCVTVQQHPVDISRSKAGRPRHTGCAIPCCQR
jgi:hypothetical protein